MAEQTKRGLLSRPVFDSRIRSANTQKSEGFLGYFLGPCLVYMAYYAIAGSYLTQFYTDVLGISGTLMTMIPLFSKIVDAITNVIMGRVIDRTHTKQGKARPWILLSGVLLAVTGALLYMVPQAGYQAQIVWIVVSYNLYFAFAFTIYNMSHTLMIPLSTRNTKQRDGLAMLTSTGTTMLPGLLTTIILPIMINAFGVGEGSQGTWVQMMSIISVLALPATLLEYYFTKERVTEANTGNDGEKKAKDVSFKQQIKACFTDRYWVLIMLFMFTYVITNQLSTGCILYYCNWVLGNSVDSGTGYQVLVNAIGQAPLGLGIMILWPLVRKFGKRMVTLVGFLFGALGSLMVILVGSNLGLVLVGLVIKSFGALPTYTMMAQIAESLDHIEWKNKFRADGFSASMYSIFTTIAAGIAQTIILGGVNRFGYIAPASNVEVINQPDGMKTFFVVCFVGAPMLGYLIGALIMAFFDVGSKMPQISADIEARHRAEAEARGEVYISPEERAAMEQEEQDRVAEEKRIEELKESCRRSGTDFETAEAQYQAAKAVRDEETRLKAAIKTAKRADKAALKDELRALKAKAKRK